MSIILAADNFNSQPHEEADSLAFYKWAADVSFQLTASRGGWLWVLKWNYIRLHFNSQPHEEADNHIHIVLNEHGIFQLTASRGGWRMGDMKIGMTETFQLTASRGGWPKAQVYLVSTYQFQLTASRGGWQCLGWMRGERNDISTHSLTRRLTVLWRLVRQKYLHFNSQPHEEADIIYL